MNAHLSEAVFSRLDFFNDFQYGVVTTNRFPYQ